MSNAFVINTASLGQQYAYFPHLVIFSSTSIAADIPPVSWFINNGNNNIVLLYILFSFLLYSVSSSGICKVLWSLTYFFQYFFTNVSSFCASSFFIDFNFSCKSISFLFSIIDT